MKSKKAVKRVGRVIEGSENIFVDLGISRPEQELLRAKLTLQIYTILKGGNRTRVRIAKTVSGQVSPLMRNRAGNFSIGRLTDSLAALRRDAGIFGSRT